MNNFLENKKRSLVTYHPVNNQEVFKQNEKLLSDTPYLKYLNKDLYVYEDAIREVSNGPIPIEHALPLTPEGLNRLLDKGYLPGETGYCELPDGSYYSSSLTYFPNCRPEMFSWWFWWHSVDPIRYTIWYPHCHVSARAEKREVLTQPGLSNEERYIGNTHVITEYLEARKNDITITFVEPSELGLDMARFEEAGIKAHACGIVKLQKPDAIFCTMVHLVRETENGFELRSRYFIGNDLSVKLLGKYRKLPNVISKAILRQIGGVELAYDQVLHDQIEFTNLASILPELYQEFAGQ